LLQLFNHALRHDSVTIHPYDGFSADKTLIRTRFDFPSCVPDYEVMVREMAEWMHAHASLYPQYVL
ncbi:MAG: SDR family NAD(P)-dependent oxidoreductase, partial [Clostridia bacterium]